MQITMTTFFAITIKTPIFLGLIWNQSLDDFLAIHSVVFQVLFVSKEDNVTKTLTCGSRELP